jgi:hypothetical protein
MPVLSIPQETIRVDVAFYGDADREALLQYPTADTLAKLVAQPLEVPTADFLSYYLFHRKRLGTPGYRDFRSIGRKLGVAVSHLDGCIDFNGHSINTAAGVVAQLPEISEHVGEGIGLCVVSQIHDLTEADWSPIKVQRGRGAAPSFDFEMASDGQTLVQVENKGSSVVDNQLLDERVKVQKRLIALKKSKLKELGDTEADPNPAGVRYGTITAIDSRKDGNVRCWLTDPPAELDRDPRSFRLLQRMRFLRDWIFFISPRSHLAVALSTRFADMEALNDPFELNRVSLRRGNGEPFDFTPYEAFGEHSSFLATKSRIADGPAGGVVVQISERELFLLGIREDLLLLASKQDFDQLLSYQTTAASIEKTVECVISDSRLAGFRLPPLLLEEARKLAGYVSFRLTGLIHYSAAGLVFGALALPEGLEVRNEP